MNFHKEGPANAGPLVFEKRRSRSPRPSLRFGYARSVIMENPAPEPGFLSMGGSDARVVCTANCDTGDGVVEKGTDDEQQCPTCGGRGFVPDDNDGQEEIINTRQPN
jgi:hypothetical protein